MSHSRRSSAYGRVDVVIVDDLLDEMDRELELARASAHAAVSAVVAAGDALGSDVEVPFIEEEVGEGAVLVRATSENRKLSPVVLDDVGGDRLRPRAVGPFCSSTFAPVSQTCPRGCAFRDNGCMAQAGYTGRPNRRLERNARGIGPDELARLEAASIDATFPGGVPRDGGRDGTRGRDLRLHVSGDVTTKAGQRALVGAAARWRMRGGGSVWTFTHSWRELPGEEWGEVSVLASVEDARESELARARGYAPALVVASAASGKAFSLPGSTTRWIPCPAELGESTCVECRLCLDRSSWLADADRGIAFVAHGPQAARAARRLPVVAP